MLIEHLLMLGSSFILCFRHNIVIIVLCNAICIDDYKLMAQSLSCFKYNVLNYLLKRVDMIMLCTRLQLLLLCRGMPRSSICSVADQYASKSGQSIVYASR